MDSQAITNPFKYLYENINIDIWRGISTNLIQSNILEIWSNYWLSSNWTFENSLQILKIEDKAVSSTQSKNVYTEETMIEDSLNCLRDKKKVEYIHDYQSLKSNDTLHLYSDVELFTLNNLKINYLNYCRLKKFSNLTKRDLN